MRNRILTFTRTLDDDNWSVTTDTGDPESYARVCTSTFNEYVNLPERVLEFQAIFSVRKPVGDDHFKLIPDPDPDDDGDITLKTNMGIEWYSSAQALLLDLHQAGYRYVRVEY